MWIHLQNTTACCSDMKRFFCGFFSYIRQIPSLPNNSNSDLVNYWPGKHNTAFLVVFTDLCVFVISNWRFYYL